MCSKTGSHKLILDVMMEIIALNHRLGSLTAMLPKAKKS